MPYELEQALASDILSDYHLPPLVQAHPEEGEYVRVSQHGQDMRLFEERP
jgi:hypothetical protein